MLSHVVVGVHPSSSLESGTTLQSIGGSTINVRSGLSLIGSEGASQIDSPDTLANNGIAHGINRVLGRAGNAISILERLCLETDAAFFATALFNTSGLAEEELLSDSGKASFFAPIDSGFEDVEQ